MSDIETTADFKSNVKAVACRLLANELSKKEFATELKLLLIQNGILDRNLTYEGLKSDTKAMDVIQSYLAEGIDDVLGTSTQFGLGIVSPFQLYFNMSGQRNFKDVLRPLNLTMEQAES
jgi:hypothetical protein